MKKFKNWLDIKQNESTMDAGVSQSPALMAQLAKMEEKLKLIYDQQHDDQIASLHIVEKMKELEGGIGEILDIVNELRLLNRRKL
jgi:hypothetical protein